MTKITNSVAFETGSGARAFWTDIEVGMKSKSFSDRKVQIALGSAILCLIVVSVGSFRGMVVSEESEVWVRHTHMVIGTLQDLLFAAGGIDSNAREYGLTGRASRLQSYGVSRQSVEQDQTTLRKLTVDNPHQQVRIPKLERLTSQKLARAEAIIRRRDSNSLDAAEAGKNGTDDAIDNQFQKLVGDMRGEEHRSRCRVKTGPFNRDHRLTSIG
jgi:CHASE3 domain sensor protein